MHTTNDPRPTTLADPRSLGTVLTVWAHPDDESFLAGGLLGTVTAAGGRAVCVTATDGDAGGPPGVARREVAALRRAELDRALDRLGVTERHRLGHPDGGCDRVPANVAVRALVHVLEAVRPDTIVTFGPDGMTGHPDHRAVSAWVGAAWRADGRRARLLQATMPTGFARRHQRVNRLLGAFEPGLPIETPDDELAVRYVLPPEVLDRKVAALREHASQVGPIEALIGADGLRAWLAEECFAEAPMWAGAKPPRTARRGGRAGRGGKPVRVRLPDYANGASALSGITVGHSTSGSGFENVPYLGFAWAR